MFLIHAIAVTLFLSCLLRLISLQARPEFGWTPTPAPDVNVIFQRHQNWAYVPPSYTGSVGQFPGTRMVHSFVAFDNEFAYLFGGRNYPADYGPNTYTNELWRYSATSRTWRFLDTAHGTEWEGYQRQTFRNETFGNGNGPRGVVLPHIQFPGGRVGSGFVVLSDGIRIRLFGGSGYSTTSDRSGEGWLLQDTWDLFLDNFSLPRWHFRSIAPDSETWYNVSAKTDCCPAYPPGTFFAATWSVGNDLVMTMGPDSDDPAFLEFDRGESTWRFSDETGDWTLLIDGPVGCFQCVHWKTEISGKTILYMLGARWYVEEGDVFKLDLDSEPFHWELIHDATGPMLSIDPEHNQPHTDYGQGGVYLPDRDALFVYGGQYGVQTTFVYRRDGPTESGVWNHQRKTIDGASDLYLLGDYVPRWEGPDPYFQSLVLSPAAYFPSRGLIVLFGGFSDVTYWNPESGYIYQWEYSSECWSLKFCVTGWEGVECEIPTCDPGCLKNEKCIYPDHCSPFVCVDGNETQQCSGHGYCEYEGGECNCVPPWEGSECQFDAFGNASYEVCSGNGNFSFEIMTCNCTEHSSYGENCARGRYWNLESRPTVTNTLVPVPQEREGHMMWGTDYFLWIFGGINEMNNPGVGTVFNDVWMYAIETQQWELLTGGTSPYGFRAGLNFDDPSSIPLPFLPFPDNFYRNVFAYDNNPIVSGFGWKRTKGEESRGFFQFGGDASSLFVFQSHVMEFSMEYRKWALVHHPPVSEMAEERMPTRETVGDTYDWAYVQVRRNLVVEAGEFHPGNVPQSRRIRAGVYLESTDSMVMFGGFSLNCTSSSGFWRPWCSMGDFWEFSHEANSWKLLREELLHDSDYFVARKGVASADIFPPQRDGHVIFAVDREDMIYVFGGRRVLNGDLNQLATRFLNDLWRYHRWNHEWTWVSGGLEDDSGLYSLGFIENGEPVNHLNPDSLPPGEIGPQYHIGGWLDISQQYFYVKWWAVSRVERLTISTGVWDKIWPEDDAVLADPLYRPFTSSGHPGRVDEYSVHFVTRTSRAYLFGGGHYTGLSRMLRDPDWEPVWTEIEGSENNALWSFDHARFSCSGNGSFSSASDRCVCHLPQYDSLAFCSRWTCFGTYNDNQDVCTMRGQCVAPDACQCRNESHPSVRGEECEIWDCYGISNQNRSVCYGEGLCLLENDCSNCSLDYYGRNCDEFIASGGVFVSEDEIRVLYRPSAVALPLLSNTLNCSSLLSDYGDLLLNSWICTFDPSNEELVVRVDGLKLVDGGMLSLVPLSTLHPVSERAYVELTNSIPTQSVVTFEVEVGLAVGFSLILVLCVVCFMLLVVVGCYAKLKYRRYRPLTQRGKESEFFDQLDAVEYNLIPTHHLRIDDFKERGQGGNGTLYDCLWGSTKTIAKEIRHPARDRAALERGLREARIQMKLRPDDEGALANWHICQMYGVSLKESSVWLILERCDGDLQSRLLDSDDPTSCEQKLDWLRQIATAMNCMHHQKPKPIIHRDLKPSNILLKGSKALVSDFGLARKLREEGEEEITRYTLEGSPSFMPPEHNDRNSPMTPAFDVYSFGVLIWVVMHDGASPYPGVNDDDILRSLQENPMKSKLRTLPGRKWLTSLVNKCLHSDPLQRPAFADILRRLMFRLDEFRNRAWLTPSLSLLVEDRQNDPSVALGELIEIEVTCFRLRVLQEAIEQGFKNARRALDAFVIVRRGIGSEDSTSFIEILDDDDLLLLGDETIIAVVSTDAQFGKVELDDDDGDESIVVLTEGTDKIIHDGEEEDIEMEDIVIAAQDDEEEEEEYEGEEVMWECPLCELMFADEEKVMHHVEAYHKVRLADQEFEFEEEIVILEERSE